MIGYFIPVNNERYVSLFLEQQKQIENLEKRMSEAQKTINRLKLLLNEAYGETSNLLENA